MSYTVKHRKGHNVVQYAPWAHITLTDKDSAKNAVHWWREGEHGIRHLQVSLLVCWMSSAPSAGEVYPRNAGLLCSRKSACFTSLKNLRKKTCNKESVHNGPKKPRTKIVRNVHSLRIGSPFLLRRRTTSLKGKTPYWKHKTFPQINQWTVCSLKLGPSGFGQKREGGIWSWFWTSFTNFSAPEKARCTSSTEGFCFRSVGSTGRGMAGSGEQRQGRLGALQV